MATPYRAEIVPTYRLEAQFHALLDAELQPAERVVWVGVPRSSRLRARALSDLAFALLWNVAIALLISGMASVAGLLCLFGVPFLVIGLSLFPGPVQAFRDAVRTFYVLTDARAIVFEGCLTSSVSRARMRRLARARRGDGSGDLVFFEEARARGTRRVGFYGVERVRDVEKLMDGRASAEESASTFS